MLEPKDLELDGRQFKLNPLKGFKAMRLDKKVVSLLLPVLKGVKDLDSEINIGEALGGFSQALDDMKDSEYEKFVVDLLSCVQYFPEGKPPIELDRTTIDNEFMGNSLLLYKLMFEVMKYNQFSPFALVSQAGNGTQKINISALLTGNQKE